MTDEYAVLGMRVLGFYSHATTLQVLIAYSNLADCKSSLAPKVVSFVFWDDKYQSTICNPDIHHTYGVLRSRGTHHAYGYVLRWWKGLLI